jgi:DNA-binding XRE family transcriptional regulator
VSDDRKGGPAGQPDPLPTAFARVRKGRSVKQVTLAHQTGISIRTIQRLEKGDLDNPGIKTVATLARAMQATVDEVSEPEWRGADRSDQRNS